jgi:hypothetical protein
MWERNKFILEGSEKNMRNLFFALDLKHSLSLLGLYWKGVRKYEELSFALDRPSNTKHMGPVCKIPVEIVFRLTWKLNI